MVRKSTVFLGVFAAFTSLIGGCPGGGITIPVDLDLSGSGLGTFQVEAGVKTQLSGRFSFNAEQTIGSGSLSISNDAITITEASTIIRDKIGGQLQEGPTCLDACTASGLVSTVVCDSVCNNHNLLVTIWINTVDGTDAECESGDQYDAEVALTEETNDIESISVEPRFMGDLTKDLLNQGEFGICITVIAPITGTVEVSDLRLNVGL